MSLNSSTQHSQQQQEKQPKSFLELLPDVVILQISSHLDFDTKINFMNSNKHVECIVSRTFRKFTHIQISDEPFDSYLKSEARYLPNGEYMPEERLAFEPSKVEKVFEHCFNLRSVLLAVKLSGTKGPLLPQQPPPSCTLFDTCLYAQGGFIFRFFQLAPPRLLENLESIYLNVDLIVDSFSQLAVPCPTEDLRFAVHFLANKSFKTSVQIGFCASELREDDREKTIMLLGAMHSIAYEMQHYGCKTEIDVGNDECYCDMTIELQNFEYSFAFFYYNPSFCEAGSPSTSFDNSAFDLPELMDDPENFDAEIPLENDNLADNDSDENKLKAANISKVSSLFNDP
uniref:F-box domain-containing protein n=1 Tax=Panagrolaimus sp. PS1159 TaxID=55785 RepID=A0AC35FIN3_9BILA